MCKSKANALFTASRVGWTPACDFAIPDHSNQNNRFQTKSADIEANADADWGVVASLSEDWMTQAGMRCSFSVALESQ